MCEVSWDYEERDDGDGPYLEFRFDTDQRETLLANTPDLATPDVAAFVRSIESGEEATVRISFHSYFGPDDDPAGVVETAIFRGHGVVHVGADDSEVVIPNEVFRDGLDSLALDPTELDLRLLRIFHALSPATLGTFSEILLDIDTSSVPQETSPPKRHRHRPTIDKPKLELAELLEVLRLGSNGYVSYEQLYKYVDVQARTMRKWLDGAGLLSSDDTRLTRRIFSAQDILDKLPRYLRDNITDQYARSFVKDLDGAGLITALR